MVDELAELQAPAPDDLTSAEARRLEHLREQVEAAIPSGDPLVTPWWGRCASSVCNASRRKSATVRGWCVPSRASPQSACNIPRRNRRHISHERFRHFLCGRVRSCPLPPGCTTQFFSRSLTTLYGEVRAELNARNRLNVIRMVDDDFEDYVRRFIVAEVRQDERHGSSPAIQQQMETAYIVLEVIVHQTDHSWLRALSSA
eukprot:SM000570S18621  [mRNA]  locus=s570:1260:1967:+ [translate_table: standard]